MVFESLEPRLLLSDSPLQLPSFAAAGIVNVVTPLTSGDIKVETLYQGGVPVIRIWDNIASGSLAQIAFDQNIRINIQGRDGFSDLVTVDLGYDDGVAGTSPLTAYALMVDFSGGADVPLLSNDALMLQSSGPDFYRATSLFLRSTDDIQINSAVQVQDKLDITSEEAIGVNGVVLQAADMYLGVTKAVTDGVTLLDGLNLLGNASGSIVLSGATLQAGDIGVIVDTSVDVDTQDASYAGDLIKIATTQTQSNAAITVSGASNLAASTGALTLRATSTVNATTSTQPDASSNQSDKDASIALSFITSTANVTVGGTAMLSATGALTVATTNNVTATTKADGGAGSSSGSAVGGTVAGTVIGGATQTVIGGTASLGGGSIVLSALTTRSVDTQARSTQGGATSGATQTTGQQKLQQQDAGTSDGSLQLAAAVAFTNITGDSEVLVSSGGALVSGGAIAIDAGATLAGPAGGVMTLADGANTQAGSIGIGVGAAINTANVTSRVQFSGATTLTAPAGVAAQAMLTSAQFGAQATSGAGGSSVGVAGSLAINAGVTRAEALLAPAANLTFTGNTAFSLTSQATTLDKARAVAKVEAGGDAVGIGASVAINVSDAVSRAIVDTNARLAGVGALTLDARSDNTVATEVKGGSAGGTAITPAAAITIATSDTLAELRSAVQALTAQGLTLNADHVGSAKTTAEGAAQGSNLAVGISLAFGSVVDTTRVLLDRSASVGGALAATASSRQSSSSTAKASAKGGKQDDGTQDGGVDQQIGAQRGAGDSQAAGKGGRDSSAAGATPQAKTADKDGGSSGSSSVSVAGAVGIGVGTSRTSAAIGNGRTIAANGAATIKSTADTDVASVADGSAVSSSGGTSVGAAVAINVADVLNRASIGTGTTLGAQGISVIAEDARWRRGRHLLGQRDGGRQRRRHRHGGRLGHQCRRDQGRGLAGTEREHHAGRRHRVFAEVAVDHHRQCQGHGQGECRQRCCRHWRHRRHQRLGRGLAGDSRHQRTTDRRRRGDHRCALEQHRDHRGRRGVEPVARAVTVVPVAAISDGQPVTHGRSARGHTDADGAKPHGQCQPCRHRVDQGRGSSPGVERCGRHFAGLRFGRRYHPRADRPLGHGQRRVGSYGGQSPDQHVHLQGQCQGRRERQ